MKIILKICLVATMVSLCSCKSSSQDAQDAFYWKQRYDRLLKFVESKGLTEEAEREIEQPEVKHLFIVRENSYIYNGSEFEITEIDRIASEITPKSQRVSIIAHADVKYDRFFTLMDALNRAGIENYNLITERN